MKRLALVGASLVLVGGMATACGSAPEDADKGDFCKATEKFLSSENEDDFNDAKDKLNDVGTPKEIKGDARKGFELLADVKWDERNDDDFSKDEQKQGEAFVTKYMELCADTNAPTGTDSDAPSELPSDLPSELEDLPSDLQSQLEDLPTEIPSE
ncbi:hypothetical protein ACLM5J_04110 [Nocardioides sp. Bht2]|uniref:hypothetical protein n=1 Tax=Nocardioides sp. Bht2 TaxID=3392297 RepID=UPI0039B3BF7D